MPKYLCIEGYTFFVDVIDQLSQILHTASSMIKIFHDGKEIRACDPVEPVSKAFPYDNPLVVKIGDSIYKTYTLLASVLAGLQKEYERLSQEIAKRNEDLLKTAVKKKALELEHQSALLAMNQEELAQKTAGELIIQEAEKKLCAAEAKRKEDEKKQKALEAQRKARAIPSLTKEEREKAFFGNTKVLKELHGFDAQLQQEIKEVVWEPLKSEMVIAAEWLIKDLNVEVLPVPMSSEANRRIWIYTFMVMVFRISAGNYNALEHCVESEYSIYAYDYDYKEKERRVDLCVLNAKKKTAILLTEIKGDSVDEGIYQNADQLRAYASSTLAEDAFGIVTNGLDWYFTHYNYQSLPEKEFPGVVCKEDFAISKCYRINYPDMLSEQIVEVIKAMLSAASIANKIIGKKA